MDEKMSFIVRIHKSIHGSLDNPQWGRDEKGWGNKEISYESIGDIIKIIDRRPYTLNDYYVYSFNDMPKYMLKDFINRPANVIIGENELVLEPTYSLSSSLFSFHQFDIYGNGPLKGVVEILENNALWSKSGKESGQFYLWTITDNFNGILLKVTGKIHVPDFPEARESNLRYVMIGNKIKTLVC